MPLVRFCDRLFLRGNASRSRLVNDELSVAVSAKRCQRWLNAGSCASPRNRVSRNFPVAFGRRARYTNERAGNLCPYPLVFLPDSARLYLQMGVAMPASRSFGRSHPARALKRILSILFVGVTVAMPLQASPPSSDDDGKNQLVGKPSSLVVQPSSITLIGPKSTQQIVVTGAYPDGTVRDLTPFCEFSVDPPTLALVRTGGFVGPRQNGAGVLVVKAGAQTARVPVTVKEFDRPQPVSFRHEVIGAFNVGGCNAGACHGTPSGKNGFRLSLRGYDPAADYTQLTRDVFGRRTDRLDPQESLIYQKALGRVPHEGGQRFAPSSLPASMLRDWLSEGLRDDPASLPSLTTLDVLPGSRVLVQPARWQQLAVLAHFSDGSVRDVTRLTVFTSSDPAVASVDASGLVEFQQSGEVAILCRYLDALHALRLTYLEPKKGFVWVSPSGSELRRHARLRQAQDA